MSSRTIVGETQISDAAHRQVEKYSWICYNPDGEILHKDKDSSPLDRLQSKHRTGALPSTCIRGEAWQWRAASPSHL